MHEKQSSIVQIKVTKATTTTTTTTKRKSSSSSSSLIVELASSRYALASLALVAADVATVATAATDELSSSFVRSFNRSIVVVDAGRVCSERSAFLVRWWVGWRIGWLVGWLVVPGRCVVDRMEDYDQSVMQTHAMAHSTPRTRTTSASSEHRCNI